MGSVTYTIQELLALRRTGDLPSSTGILRAHNPRDDRVKSYLALFRKYTKLLADGPEAFRLKYKPESTIVRKYDFALSNKEFKRRWVKSHGTTAGLNSLPRVPVRVFSLRVRFLEEFLRAVTRTERLLMKLLGRFGRSTGKVNFPKPIPGPVPTAPSRKYKPPRGERKRAVKLQVDPVHGDYFRVIGGLTYTYDASKPPPSKEWTKYWYYYRKYGRWRPSEHHPYGDEVEKIPHVYGNSLIYPHG
jgi:hypothetical protein